MYSLYDVYVLYIHTNTVAHGIGGGIRGPFWSISAIFDLNTTIPTRARACNDCAQHTVLLKTRSSGGPGYPRFGRVLTLTDWHTRHTVQIYENILTSTVCADMYYYTDPQNGPILWVQITRQILRFQVPIWGGYHGVSGW